MIYTLNTTAMETTSEEDDDDDFIVDSGVDVETTNKLSKEVISIAINKARDAFVASLREQGTEPTDVTFF